MRFGSRSEYGYWLQAPAGAHAHIPLALWLRDRYEATDKIALGDAGAIPFYSGLPAIDLWGLNTAEISRLPGEYGLRAGAVAWALSQEPRAFILWSRDPLSRLRTRQSFDHGTHFGRELIESPDFHRRYQASKEFVFREAEEPGSGYYVAVFEKRSAAAERSAP